MTSAHTGPTAFVLGGGGILGSAEVGMLQALLERDIKPDLIVGSSVGALNGLAAAASPDLGAIARLRQTWMSLHSGDVFSSSVVGQVTNVLRHGTYLHSNAGLRRMIEVEAAGASIEDLAVPFQCVAACIEEAAAHWFTSGPIVEAVLASCAVPGLLPAVRIGERHYVDGGLVASVPVGRAAHLGAKRIYVLQVGRIERKLTKPVRPWEVAVVAFEIARRHQFADDLTHLPEGVEVHVLPTGDIPPSISVRYRSPASVQRRIEAAYEASSAYLEHTGG